MGLYDINGKAVFVSGRATEALATATGEVYIRFEKLTDYPWISSHSASSFGSDGRLISSSTLIAGSNYSMPVEYGGQLRILSMRAPYKVMPFQAYSTVPEPHKDTFTSVEIDGIMHEGLYEINTWTASTAYFGGIIRGAGLNHTLVAGMIRATSMPRWTVPPITQKQSIMRFPESAISSRMHAFSYHSTEGDTRYYIPNASYCTITGECSGTYCLWDSARVTAAVSAMSDSYSNIGTAFVRTSPYDSGSKIASFTIVPQSAGMTERSSNSIPYNSTSTSTGSSWPLKISALSSTYTVMSAGYVTDSPFDAAGFVKWKLEGYPL